MATIGTPPRIDDGMLPYFYLPYGPTLYGHDGKVSRWLRVTDDENATIQTVSIGGVVTDVVHCYGLHTYLTYITFGFTPFLEVAMSGMRTGVDITQDARLLITQACHRSYESRVSCLLGLAHRKRRSLLTRDQPASAELSDELASCLILWEQLMDSGIIRPTSCLRHGAVPSGPPLGHARMRWFESKRDELAGRSATQDFVRLPYKMAADVRMSFLNAYGVQI